MPDQKLLYIPVHGDFVAGRKRAPPTLLPNHWPDILKKLRFLIPDTIKKTLLFYSTSLRKHTASGGAPFRACGGEKRDIENWVLELQVDAHWKYVLEHVDAHWNYGTIEPLF